MMIEARKKIEALMSIESACYDAKHCWTAAEFEATMKRPEIRLYTAETAAGMLGFIILKVHERKLQLLNLAVMPSCRRKRVASNLLGRSILANPGPRRYVAWVCEYNLAAQLFLRSHKFQAVEFDRHRYGESGGIHFVRTLDKH